VKYSGSLKNPHLTLLFFVCREKSFAQLDNLIEKRAPVLKFFRYPEKYASLF